MYLFAKINTIHFVLMERETSSSKIHHYYNNCACPKYEHAHVVPLEKDQVYDPADASK